MQFWKHFVIQKVLERSVFYIKDKRKSKVLVSTELYVLQKLYWATKLIIYNIEKLS